MQKNNSFWLGIGILVATILAGGFLFLRPHSALAPTSATSTSSSMGSTTDLGNGIVATGPSGAKIEIVNNTVAAPSLNGPVVVSASLSVDAQTVLRQSEANLIASLKKDPTRVDLWLQLGVDRKIAGDYAGAIAAWNYVAEAGPASINYIAYGNLGDLYMNFQVNYPKAEADYKAAIAIKPDVIDYYKSLFTLYTSFYKTNTTAAADIVAQGLKANPNNPDLLRLQAQLTSSTQ